MPSPGRSRGPDLPPVPWRPPGRSLPPPQLPKFVRPASPSPPASPRHAHVYPPDVFPTGGILPDVERCEAAAATAASRLSAAEQLRDDAAAALLAALNDLQEARRLAGLPTEPVRLPGQQVAAEAAAAEAELSARRDNALRRAAQEIVQLRAELSVSEAAAAERSAEHERRRAADAAEVMEGRQRLGEALEQSAAATARAVRDEQRAAEQLSAERASRERTESGLNEALRFIETQREQMQALQQQIQELRAKRSATPPPRSPSPSPPASPARPLIPAVPSKAALALVADAARAVRACTSSEERTARAALAVRVREELLSQELRFAALHEREALARGQREGVEEAGAHAERRVSNALDQQRSALLEAEVRSAKATDRGRRLARKLAAMQEDNAQAQEAVKQLSRRLALAESLLGHRVADLAVAEGRSEAAAPSATRAASDSPRAGDGSPSGAGLSEEIRRSFAMLQEHATTKAVAATAPPSRLAFSPSPRTDPTAPVLTPSPTRQASPVVHQSPQMVTRCIVCRSCSSSYPSSRSRKGLWSTPPNFLGEGVVSGDLRRATATWAAERQSTPPQTVEADKYTWVGSAQRRRELDAVTQCFASRVRRLLQTMADDDGYDSGEDGRGVVRVRVRVAWEGGDETFADAAAPPPSAQTPRQRRSRGRALQHAPD
eukprot:TRINITY_DN20517_c0_g1_i1.p1 TRINITY_DN20517_c0_g1~~TRINITY_DN20517_c0_g1_i1.p1  ORF type:complete len:682 (+),score=225.68 TRINITY_DN20517_c0_g1_i1:45-2048(+)